MSHLGLCLGEGAPVHDAGLIGCVHIVLGCRPQQMPQLHICITQLHLTGYEALFYVCHMGRVVSVPTKLAQDGPHSLPRGRKGWGCT